MKAIILVSSIFYILGLKISNKVDFLRKNNITPVVTNKLEKTEKPGINTYYHKEIKSVEQAPDPDSLKINGSSAVVAPRTKEEL